MAVKTEESHPLLLFCHGKARKTQIVYSISDKSHSTYSLPNMRNKSVLASNFGWLVLDDYNTDDCCLLNIRSKEKVNLPKTRFGNSIGDCIFTSAPTDPNCRVLMREFGGHVARFCKIGDNSFLKQKIDINGCALMSIIAFKGKVYGQTSRGALVEVEFRARSLQFGQVIQELVGLGRVGVHCGNNYLVESDNELLYVLKSCLGRHHNAETFDFLIFRADFERRKWVEMKSLGDRALFLSGSEWCKSCSASHANIKGNCIYYVETSDNRNLYVFDMEDRSITASSPYRKVDNENLDLYWI